MGLHENIQAEPGTPCCKIIQSHCKSWPCLTLPLSSNQKIRLVVNLFSPAGDTGLPPDEHLQWANLCLGGLHLRTEIKRNGIEVTAVPKVAV